MWKNEVLAMLVTGDRTCCRAWITFTRNASTAFLPMSSRYTREISTSPLWLYTKRPPIIFCKKYKKMVIIVKEKLEYGIRNFSTENVGYLPVCLTTVSMANKSRLWSAKLIIKSLLKLNS